MKTKLKKIVKFMLKLSALSCTFGIGAFILVWVLFPFPKERFDKWPVSPSVLDAKGRTFLSIVGPDDQWRLPIKLDEISPWVKMATVAVEDERFYNHFGVDPLAVIRAAV